MKTLKEIKEICCPPALEWLESIDEGLSLIEIGDLLIKERRYSWLKWCFRLPNDPSLCVKIVDTASAIAHNFDVLNADDITVYATKATLDAAAVGDARAAALNAADAVSYYAIEAVNNSHIAEAIFKAADAAEVYAQANAVSLNNAVDTKDIFYLDLWDFIKCELRKVGIN